MKFKVGGAVGALVLAIATPVALAQAGGDDGAEAASTAVPETGDLICFEIDDPFFGEFGFEEDWPFEEGMALEGEWPEDSEWLEGFEENLPPLPDQIIEMLNQEAVELAAHLDLAGIAYEIVEGPMGETWVEWDFADDAANQAVEEFYAGREDPFEFLIEEFPFEEIPFDDFPFGFEDFDEGEFGEFIFEGPEGMLEFGGEFPFGEDFPFGGVICIEPPAMQAEMLSGEMQGLADALTEAGISFTTETVQMEVPVWNLDDDAAREVVEQYYSGMHDAEFEGWFGDAGNPEDGS